MGVNSRLWGRPVTLIDLIPLREWPREEAESILPDHTAPAGEPQDVEKGDRRRGPKTGGNVNSP